MTILGSNPRKPCSQSHNTLNFKHDHSGFKSQKALQSKSCHLKRPVASSAMILCLPTSRFSTATGNRQRKRNPSYSLRCLLLSPAMRLTQEWLNRLRGDFTQLFGWLVRMWHDSRVVAILVALQAPLNDTVTQRQQLPKPTVLGQSKENALKYCKRQIRSVLKIRPDMWVTCNRLCKKL
jgi:hypothetical protein